MSQQLAVKEPEASDADEVVASNSDIVPGDLMDEDFADAEGDAP